MNIRRFENGDEFRELVRDSIEDIDRTEYSEEDMEYLIENIPELNMEFAEDDRFRYFVALEKGEMVGIAGYKVESGTVSGVFTSPERKESGIGSKLLETLEENARSEGNDSMKVPASMDAVDFYIKNGYRKTERKFKDVKGRDIEMEIMEKEL